MENNDKREQYKHSKSKGCTVHFLRKEYIEKNIVCVHICDTHQVEICRCGMEWGYHTGEHASLIED